MKMKEAMRQVMVAAVKHYLNMIDIYSDDEVNQLKEALEVTAHCYVYHITGTNLGEPQTLDQWINIARGELEGDMADRLHEESLRDRQESGL